MAVKYAGSLTIKRNGMRVSRAILVSLMTVNALVLTGCVESAVKTADNQANARAKATPINMNISAPFDAVAAKAALAKGAHTLNGVLYHRLTISGRDDFSWPQSHLVKNQPFKNFEIYLYPASPAVVEFDKLFEAQHSTMKKWYLNPPSVFNQQPQTKRFVLPNGVGDNMLTAKTDDFGRYTFKHLKPGRYFLFASGWIKGKYNKEVYAGSSEYSDGTGIYGQRGTVDHTKLEPVNYQTYLVYREFVTVGNSQATVDSRLRVDYNEMSVHNDK